MPVLLCLVSPNVKYPIAIAAILWIFVAVNPITFSIGSLQQRHVQNMAEISDIPLEEHFWRSTYSFLQSDDVNFKWLLSWLLHLKLC